MSNNLRFIIAQKNIEPAPPEFEYYCGISTSYGKGTATAELETVKAASDILWDDRSAARKFSSLSDIAAAVAALEKLGFENLRVFELVISYEPVDTDDINRLVRERRVNDIINQLSQDDIKYLRSVGVLHLTNVT